MKLVPSQLKAYSMLLGFLEFADARGGAEGQDPHTDCGIETRHVQEPVLQALEARISELNRRLGDRDFMLNGSGMHAHIRTLQRRFLGALRGTELYPYLDREAEARVLLMSPEDFKKDCGYDACYLSLKDLIVCCRHEIEARVDKRQRLESEEQHVREALLRKNEKKLALCEDRLREYEGLEVHYRTVLLMLDEMLGSDSISAAYESYVAGLEPHFPVDLPVQEAMYRGYLRTVEGVREGAGGVFYPSLIDMEKIRTFRTSKTHSLLVIDVGGSFLKVATVEMRPGDSQDAGGPGMAYKTDVQVCKREYVSPDGERPINTYRWHEWVADAVVECLRGSSGRVEFAALTFSYPIVQKSLGKATVKSVHKNWMFRDVKDSPDEDIVEALNASLEARGAGFRVNCVLNDSVATYVAGLTADSSSARIGMIIGTGTNGAFEVRMPGGAVLMNTEWAKTEVPPCLLTEADKRVVRALEQQNTPHQLLEVLAAGYKFVEIVRERLLILGAGEAEGLDLSRIIGVLDKDVRDLTAFERGLRDVAVAYKRRAGRMLAPILLAIATSIGARDIVLTMNGSVCRSPLDRLIILEELDALAERLGLQHCFTCLHLDDASLIGAAFTALANGLVPSSE